MPSAAAHVSQPLTLFGTEKSREQEFCDLIRAFRHFGLRAKPRDCVRIVIGCYHECIFPLDGEGIALEMNLLRGSVENALDFRVVLTANIHAVVVRINGAQNSATGFGVYTLATDNNDLAKSLPLKRELMIQELRSPVGQLLHSHCYFSFWLVHRQFVFFPTHSTASPANRIIRCRARSMNRISTGSRAIHGCLLCSWYRKFMSQLPAKNNQRRQWTVLWGCQFDSRSVTACSPTNMGAPGPDLGTWDCQSPDSKSCGQRPSEPLLGPVFASQ